MIGAACAASDSNMTALGSDLADNAITQHLDAVEDNATEKSISDDNALKSENALKKGAYASDSVLKDSGTTEVNNWGELASAINDGAMIELSGDDVYYAEGSGITIDSVTVTIDGKGHTIDAQRLNSHIFDISNGATLNLKNLTLKNALNNGDGGAIYNDQGTLTVTGCTFTNNTATTKKGGAIYNHEGTLKIVNSRFEKNSEFDKAIYNYASDEETPFKLTIINTTMIEDRVCVNLNNNERRLDDKRDIDFLTTEFNVSIQEILYNGTPVFINVSGIDKDFTGSITVNITNTIYNTKVEVADGNGSTTMNLDINRYTARFKNFIFVNETSFDRDDTKPYLEINFKVASTNSFSALEDMMNKATNNITLNQDHIYDSKTDSAYIRIVDKKLTIYGNGHSIKGNGNNGDTLFLIEDDSDVTMENMTLENGLAQSRSHLGEQIRMGGAIFVSHSNLTLINSTLKNNKANGGFGGAIYSEFSTLKIIESNFTNNNAANGKDIYVQGGKGVYILNTITDEKDIYNEPDWDKNNTLAQITIFNDFNATLYVPNHVRDDETLFNITQPENINVVANLTINNITKDNIEFTNGYTSANLNLDIGFYIATITTPEFVYYTDSARNLTCTYLSATTISNEFTVLPRTYIVNNSNVGEIFTTDGTLSDLIKLGDILDFQGTIDKNRNLIINKPVNIISSTNDAVINLHTVIGDSVDGIPKFSFIINEGASGSNISDLYINNTQTWIYHVDGLYLKNMIISVRSASGLGGDNGWGADIGHTAIRFGNHITLDNCSIFTENTQASCLVVYVTSNFTFINSKIEGQSKIRSIISFECPNDGEVYDAPHDNYDVRSTNNTIKNSVIKTGYPDAEPIKIGENVDHTTIDGVNVYASKPINPGQYATVINSNFYNASCIELGRNAVAYNNTVDGSGSKIQNGANAYNNTFNSVTIGNVVFENNIVKNKLTVTSPANVNRNTIKTIELSSGSKYSNITNNIISDTITVNEVNVTIKDNTINTTNGYAVVVNKTGAVVTNNMMWAKTKFGDNAVDRYQDTTVVEDNTPEPSFNLLQFQINKATGNITLGQDFGYNPDIDDQDGGIVINGIVINKDLTINGNGYTIDGNRAARIFQITDGANVVIENVTFINGKAQSEEYKGNNHDVGGAIAVKGHSNLTIINCSFTNNNAEQYGWGGAIFITGNSTLSIMTSNFTDSNAQNAGNVIYALDGNYVHILECNVDGINLGDVDIDDMGDYIYNDKDNMGLTAPIKIFKTPNLMANILDNNESEEATIIISEPSKFNGMAKLTVDNKTISNIQFNEGTAHVQLDVTPGKAYSATITTDYAEYARDISLNIAMLYVPTTTQTNSFKVMKKPNIQFDVQNITYNQTQTIKATVNGTGYVTIKLLNGQTILDNKPINKTVSCTIDNLDAGNYSIELNYSGDEFTLPGEAVFNFTVFKANSSLEINDIVFDYNSTGSTSFSCDNASDVRAEVVDHPNAVNVNGNVIHVSNLNAGNYTLRVTTVTDDNHNNITKTANIIVNRVNSTIAIPKIILDYGETKTVNVNATEAKGITAKINGRDVSVNGFTIQISGLNVTTNTLTVTTVVDDNHNPVTDTVNIVVNKVNSSIDRINDIVLDYGKSSTVNVTTEGATGITAKIDNNNVNVNGFTVPISGLDAGNHTLYVTTIPDENHNAVTKTASIKVSKIASTVKIDVKPDHKVGESFEISITNNTVATVTVNGKNYAIKNGKVDINTASLPADTYKVIATIAENNNYVGSSDTSTFTISKYNAPEIVIDAETSVVEGTNLDVGVSIGDAAGIVNINGVNKTLANGKASATIKNVKVGNLAIEVTYYGDAKYMGSSKTANVNVYAKKNPNLKVVAENIKVGETATINVEINPEVTGKVIIGNDEVSIYKGKGTHNISGLAAGNYSYVVKFVGDKYFNAENFTVSFRITEVESPINNTNATTGNSTENNSTSGNATDNNNTENNSTITKEDPNLSVGVASVNVGDVAVVNVSMNSRVNGNVVIVVNDKDYNVPVSNGKGSQKISGLAAGSYSVVARFAGDNNFNAAVKTVSFNVVEVENPNNNTNASTGNATGNNTSSGNATGNNENNTSATIADPDLNVSVGDVYVGEAAVVNISINKNVTGKVAVKFNGIATNVDVSNGKGTYSISNLGVGSYSVVVRFVGDDKFNASEKTVSFNVIKPQSPINNTNGSGENKTNNDVVKVIKTALAASSLTTVYNGGKYIVVTLKASGNPLKGVKVTVKFSNGVIDTKFTDKNGQVKFSTNGLAPKTYSATISFAGNAKYAKSTKTVYVKVIKATPKLIASKKTFKKSTKTKKYIVALKTNQNKAMKKVWVSLKVNKKIYKVKTNSKGQAIFKITNLMKNGIFTAVVKYAGNKYYNAKTVKAKITVK